MQQTYLNPVHNRSCPDPFVLKYLNEYWCYCTGIWHDGRCFGILRSRDLVHWEELGGALAPLDQQATCYWAPEVIYDNGRFLMYYSVGNEERMQIRVASATHPAGPFIDQGVRLTKEDFAIDAHVFIDNDGTRWMFYATDFLEHTHIGTGTVCDKMLDEFTLAGNAQPVTRARYPWQVYDPERKEKGGVCWYTVEGPFVLKHKQRYFQIFSSGNWQQASYGVSYASSDRLATAEEWEQFADGEQVLPILRTVPGQVIGPGHNSVVRGPDNQQLFCVYHRWAEDAQARVLAIDPMDWAGDRLLVLGPSYQPQPLPVMPLYADYFDNQDDETVKWQYTGGQWRRGAGVLKQNETEGEAEARCLTQTVNFVAEVSLRLPNGLSGEGTAAIKLIAEKDDVLLLTLLPEAGQAVLAAQLAEYWIHENFSLPKNFDYSAFHLVRLEVNGLRVRVTLDDYLVQWEQQLAAAPQSLAFKTKNATAEFAGFALTSGWQDWFATDEADPAALGWQTTANEDRWRISEQQLWFLGPHGEGSILTKGPLPANYELVINAKLLSEPETGEGYGFYPALGADAASPLLTVERQEDGWALGFMAQDERQLFALPSKFDPATTQQFRFRKEQNRLKVYLEAELLGEIEVPIEVTMLGLYGFRAIVAFDLVRVTGLQIDPEKAPDDNPYD